MQQFFKWLLFFYTVPAKPGNLRVKVWRRLLKLGAVSLKGSVYLLPFSEDHLEALQWLTGEVAGLGGEAAFVKAAAIDSVSDGEIMALFNTQREHDYSPVATALEALELQLASLEQQERPQVDRLEAAYRKVLKDYRAVLALDFFHAPGGVRLGEGLEDFAAKLKKLTGEPVKVTKTAGSLRKEDYRNKVWMTRRKPFVDRMASAWLIRRFLDPEARFEFLAGESGASGFTDAVSFDVPGGDFTHEQDRCTFEVLLESFGLRGKALRKIAEIVHDLDLKDGKFANPLAAGVDSILLGLRQTAAGDRETLEEGIKVFERLFAALSQ